MQALHFGFNYLHTLSSTADNHRNCSSPWMQRWTSKNTTWGGKKKKKKGHTAAIFHSVCKYCFLVKLCCESQESIRGSEILREINNMLGFSTTELKVISDPRKHRITSRLFSSTFCFYISALDGKHSLRNRGPRHYAEVFNFIQMFMQPAGKDSETLKGICI